MKKEYPPFLAKISSVLFGRTGRTARLGGGGGSREAGHFVFLRFSHVKLASNRFDVDNFTFISHNKTMIIDDGFISSPPASTSLWIFKFSTFFFQFFSVKLSSPPPAICMHSEHITCQFPYRLCDFICKIHPAAAAAWHYSLTETPNHLEIRPQTEILQFLYLNCDL